MDPPLTQVKKSPYFIWGSESVIWFLVYNCSFFYIYKKNKKNAFMKVFQTFRNYQVCFQLLARKSYVKETGDTYPVSRLSAESLNYFWEEFSFFLPWGQYCYFLLYTKKTNSNLFTNKFNYNIILVNRLSPMLVGGGTNGRWQN